MIDLAACTQHGFFGLYKIADFGFRRQHRTGTQSRKRADITVFAHNRFFEHGVSLNCTAIGHPTVNQDAVGPDMNLLSNFALPFKNAINVDVAILTHLQLTANINAAGVRQCGAVSHNRLCAAALVIAFQFVELRTIVDPLHFPGRRRLTDLDGNTIANGHFDDVGEIVFALSIVTAEPGQPLFEMFGCHGHDARVHFLNSKLLKAGVFLFNDGHNLVLLSDDTAITTRIIKVGCEQTHCLVVAVRNELVQCFRGNQRYIAIENQHPTVVRQTR